jgi:adenosylcobinamide amidohydrolase
MESRLIRIIGLVVVTGALAVGLDVPIVPACIDAKVSVHRTLRDGLWEKTLAVQFPARRRAISTNDGIIDILAAGNHAAHPAIWAQADAALKSTLDVGGKVYARIIQEQLAGRLGLRPADTAMMATAADLDNGAVVTLESPPFTVMALVTAGAKGNALRTGVDEGTYIEPDPTCPAAGTGPSPRPGTINILVLTNARLTDGGLARAVITATEAKTAALEDLGVPSSFTRSVQATGTGTDSMIVVSGAGGPLVTYPGGHSRIGELLGKAVHRAVREALARQNGFGATHASLSQEKP